MVIIGTQKAKLSIFKDSKYDTFSVFHAIIFIYKHHNLNRKSNRIANKSLFPFSNLHVPPLNAMKSIKDYASSEKIT
jgi:hypothetical protein